MNNVQQGRGVIDQQNLGRTGAASQHGVDLRHDILIGRNTTQDLLLREPDPERRVALLRLLGAVDLLRDAAHLARRVAGCLPHPAQLIQRPDVQSDLLPQVVLVVDKILERPLAQVHDRGERQNAREEVRVRGDRHVVRHHLADLARGCDDVPRVQVEVVAALDGSVGCAGCDVARGGRV